MKSILMAVLIGLAALMISSCATVSREPLEPGELRLISMDVPDRGTFIVDVEYRIAVNFQAEGHPEIKRACCYWSGDGPYCGNVLKVKYGSEASFLIPIYARPDSNRLECYAEYIQDGKRKRSNAVETYITGYSTR